MAQAQTPQHSGEAISILKVQPHRQQGIAVFSSAIDIDGQLDPRYSADGGNVSPPLSWTPVSDAGAYALIVEDPDAPREQPFVHWMIWNIHGEVDHLPEGIPQKIHPVSPQGAVQGRNDVGDTGYMGPKPPLGHGTHRYHFQVFALDGPLELQPDVDVRTLVDAIKGRTIASGELIATFEVPGDFDSPASTGSYGRPTDDQGREMPR
jgi:Raf kinase inhibitor-like YbhB/YbcL family protein